jgi:hypothetical protein
MLRLTICALFVLLGYATASTAQFVTDEVQERGNHGLVDIKPFTSLTFGNRAIAAEALSPDALVSLLGMGTIIDTHDIDVSGKTLCYSTANVVLKLSQEDHLDLTDFSLQPRGGTIRGCTELPASLSNIRVNGLLTIGETAAYAQTLFGPPLPKPNDTVKYRFERPVASRRGKLECVLSNGLSIRFQSGRIVEISGGQGTVC